MKAREFAGLINDVYLHESSFMDKKCEIPREPQVTIDRIQNFPTTRIDLAGVWLDPSKLTHSNTNSPQAMRV